jgi:hypothetical protein
MPNLPRFPSSGRSFPRMRGRHTRAHPTLAGPAPCSIRAPVPRLVRGEFEAFCNHHRPHQGIANARPQGYLVPYLGGILPAALSAGAGTSPTAD